MIRLAEGVATGGVCKSVGEGVVMTSLRVNAGGTIREVY
jgi:hypothetical protein